MTALAKWNPLREFEEMRHRLTNFLGRPERLWTGEEPFTMEEWTPAVDVTEDANEYLIKAELPEMKKEEVKVTVENGMLRIAGERKFEKEETKRKVHRIERAYGAFERRFTLPEGTETEKVKAEYKDGLLTVHLPKGKTAEPVPVVVPVM